MVVDCIDLSSSFPPLTAIGLVHGWKSFLWIACIPPILIVGGFKIWLHQTFNSAFRWYNATPQELAENKLSAERERNDMKGNRLSKRFGHPALHAELFTPMVHANMVHLLPEVYHGRLSREETGLQEFGGEKVTAAVVSGGLKIAGIEQVKQLGFIVNLLLISRCRTILSTTLHSINATVASRIRTPAVLPRRESLTGLGAPSPFRGKELGFSLRPGCAVPIPDWTHMWTMVQGAILSSINLNTGALPTISHS